MRFKTVIHLAIGASLLTGCSRDNLPDFIPEKMGGPIRRDNVRNGPLADTALDAFTAKSNRLRVTIMPSFGLYHYTFDMLPLPEGCRLVWDTEDETSAIEMCQVTSVDMVRWDKSPTQTEDTSLGTTYRFFIPRFEYDLVTYHLDYRMQRWRGSTGGVMDGTGIDFEYARHSRIRSMSANYYTDPESNPATRLADDLHRIMLAYGPSGTLPRSSDWSVDEDSEGCNNNDLATPIENGFGTEGECAREISRIEKSK